MKQDLSTETILHVRADKSRFDFYNNVTLPIKELIRYRSLIQNIISRDLKVRYKRSVLGIAWTVLAPLLSMMVLWAVFTYAMKVQVPNYAAYLLSGIIMWNLFLQSSAAGCSSILVNVGIIQKVRLPRVVFPISTVVNNVVNFCFAFCALMLVILVTGAQFHWTLILTPFVLVPIILFAMGWAMMVSSLSVFFRDLPYILEILLGAMFYVTPIIYQAENLPKRFWFLVSFNPMAKYIHLFRTLAYSGELPDWRTYLAGLGMGLVMFVVGWVVFHKLERRFIYWL